METIQLLREHFPLELAIEIVIFEGTVVEDFLRQYICEVYSGIYQTYFGRKHNLKKICDDTRIRHIPLGTLPFYSTWSTLIRERYPHFVKARKTKKFMAPYHGLISFQKLHAIRKQIEAKVKMRSMRGLVTEQLMQF